MRLLIGILLAAAFASLGLAQDPPPAKKHVTAKKTSKKASKSTATKTTPAKSAVSKPVSTKPASKTTSASKTTTRHTSKSGKSASGKKAVASSPRRSAQQQPTPSRYKEIQQALADKGYFAGSPDGNWGPDSIDALKRFQHDQSLTEDGKIGSLSLIALGLGPQRVAVAAPSQ